MKKYILLTTTAMLLSAVAMKTNAEPSNSTTLNITASFFKPMELIREQNLGFGIILADEGGKTVIVKTNGALDSQSTATMMSTASYTQYSNGGPNFGYFSEGLIRAKGLINNNNEEGIENLFTINLSTPSIKLVGGDNGTTECGTVDEFTTRITKEGDDVLFHVGGTLTTAKLTEFTDIMIHCQGSVTATIIINEELLKSID